MEESGFPQILYIGKKVDDPGYSKKFVWNYHSCVVLGRSEDGDLLVWEKIAEQDPFALTNLQDVLARYPKADRFARRLLGRAFSEVKERGSIKN